MASAETPLRIVAEWKRKAFEFSDESTDALASVFSRTLEAISIIQKNPKQCHIRRALASIEFELTNCLRCEESTVTSVRTLMFGLIESFHLTLTHLTEERKDGNEKAISTIKEWKKKCFEFSDQSTDALVSVISKGFDSMLNIVKNLELSTIRRSLKVFDFERSDSFRDENFGKLSIRSLMFGLLESIHLILQHLIEKKNQPTTSEEIQTEQIPTPPPLIHSSNLNSTESLDQYSTIPTFTTTFPSEPKKEPVESSAHGENEKSGVGFIGDEIKEEDTVSEDKKSIYIPRNSLNSTVTNRIDSLDRLSTIPTFTTDVKVEPKQELNEVSLSIRGENEMEPKDEPIDDPLLDGDQPFGLDFNGDDIKKEEDTLKDELEDPNEKPIDEPSSNNNQQFHLEFIDEFKEEPILNEDENNDIGDTNFMVDDMIEDGGEKSRDDKIDEDPKDSSETVEVETRRRSTRNVSRSVKYADSMDDSDGEDEPSVKKKRSESVEKNDKVAPQKKPWSRRVAQLKDKYSDKKELECPECEYRSRSVVAWASHLRTSHSTTPALAGCRLRCDCGNESYSEIHDYKCDNANFTIIRTGDGSIRRVNDVPLTPQCTLCEIYPKTPCGYSNHLFAHHKSTLTKAGIYLKCACGLRYNSGNEKKMHDKKCDGRLFTLHKLDEDWD